MMKKSKKNARHPGEYRNLVQVRDLIDFELWLIRNEWIISPPIAGSILTAHRYGTTISVRYDDKTGKTICNRHEMVLWHAYCFDRDFNL